MPIEIRGSKQQVTALGPEVQHLETKVNGQEQQVEELNTELDEKDVELDDLKHEARGLKQQIAAQRVKNTTQHGEIKDLKKQLQQQGKQNQGLKKALEAKVVKQQSPEAQDLKAQLDSKEATLQNILGKLATTTEVNNSVHVELTRLKANSNTKKIEDQAMQLSRFNINWNAETKSSPPSRQTFPPTTPSSPKWILHRGW